MEIVLEVPDKDVARVLELVKGIKRVKVKSPKSALTPASQAFLTGLAQAVEDVNCHIRGEIELQSWDELYTELQADETAGDDIAPAIAVAQAKPVDTKEAHV